MKIAVLGATGTVGQALLPLLAQQHEVLAVSRRPREETSGVRWAVADASDAESLKKVFDQVDIAYYLVHSLGSRDFEQRDRVAAANGARHAEQAGLRQLVYLGGLGDQSPGLSRHLRSRAETADVLASGSVPLTTLRSNGGGAGQRGLRDNRRACRSFARDDLPTLGLDADAANRTVGYRRVSRRRRGPRRHAQAVVRRRGGRTS
jgi:uncharacterized protein YbjT (DUF2867 family)